MLLRSLPKKFYQPFVVSWIVSPKQSRFKNMAIRFSRRISGSRRKGFSLIEVIAAVVILAVVATATVATIAPMREKSRAKLNQQSIAKLNGICQAYYMEYGNWPNSSMTHLFERGYTSELVTSTPYGGFYQFDGTTKTVVNPHAPQQQ